MTSTSLGTNLVNDTNGIDIDSDQKVVHRELVREFARRQGVGSAVTVAVAIIVTVVLWKQVPVDILLSWTAAQITLTIASWLRWQPFTDRNMLQNRRLPTAVEAGVWKLGSGALWGAAAIASHVYLEAPFETFVFLIIAAMAAGGTSTLSAFCEAGQAFVSALLVPTSIAFVLAGTPTDFALAVLVLLYMAAILGTVRINNRAIREVISARFRNEKMREAFQAERDTWSEISNTSEAFVIFDQEDGLFAWNARFAELMQMPADLMRRGTMREELIREGRRPAAVAAGQETMSDWIANRSHLAADLSVAEYEGGQWIRRRATKTSGGYLAISFVDVSEHKQAEEALVESEGRFRAIVNNLPGGIVLKDRDLRIQLATGTIYENVHDITGDDRVGKKIFDIIGKEDAAVVDAIDRSVLETGTVSENLQTYPGVDGTAVELLNIRFPILDDTGEIIGVGCLSQDVTEQRRTEAQLQQSQKMEMVGQLTGGIAHDFNNLLTVILGNAELLTDQVADNPLAGKLLHNMLRAAARGGDLTQRLLAFSRRQNLQPVVVDVSKTITDVMALLERTLEERNTLRFTEVDTLPHVFIDPIQLETALINLTVNARDAMPEGGLITYSATEIVIGPEAGPDDEEADLAPGRYVELSVSDNGVGMPPEVVEHIFEPFYTTKDAGKGTGLGLSMVYGFARQSGGHVSVTSVEWGGTVVKLYLPVAPDVVESETNQDVAEVATVGGAETVFVIEDDADVRTFVAASLSAKGYSVVTAGDGVAALDQLNNGLKFDLLLSDVVLPRGVTGPEFARHMRARHPHIPVLFMSGYTDDALEDANASEIGYDLIQKPFTRETLYARVRESLDHVSA